MPTIDVNGTELWYEREGAGPPCVLVHGGMGLDHRLSRASLASLVDVCDVVFYDQRGNGRSGRPPPSTITMEQLADDVAALIDRIGLDAPLVFGHSFGGFVAQELALRHPRVAGALLLVGTTPGQLGVDEDPAVGRGAALPDEAAEVLATVPVDDDELADALRRLLPWYLHRRDVEEMASMMDGAVYSRDGMVRGVEILSSPWIDEPDRFHEVVTAWLAETLGRR